MRVDLLDAQACIDWAVGQIPTLQGRISNWQKDRPYQIRKDFDSKPGKQIYRFANVRQVPAIVNAEVGQIINSLRSSLDLLAVALAARNGQVGKNDVYFPICKSVAVFGSNNKGGGMEKIKRLSGADQAVIIGLAPYRGGNDLLCALHDLDITRKHKRLIKSLIFPRGVGVSGEGGRNLSFTNTWEGFEDETIIAWSDAGASDCDFDFPLYVAFDERNAVEGKQVIAVLNDFVRLTNSIVTLFDGP